MRDKQEVEIVDFLLQVKASMVTKTVLVLCNNLIHHNRVMILSLSSTSHSLSLSLFLSLSPPLSLTQSNALKQYPSVPSQTLNVLQTQLKAVVSKLPEDLQSCLKTAFSADT